MPKKRLPTVMGAVLLMGAAWACPAVAAPASGTDVASVAQSGPPYYEDAPTGPGSWTPPGAPEAPPAPTYIPCPPSC
ncbi:MAG: hypothetical protein QG671_659 [Actinomycetota bacterium]|nr:hypothetical protein [Actinomycetota bacterium]